MSVYRGPSREDFAQAARSKGHPRPKVVVVRKAGATSGGFQVHRGALHRALGVPEGKRIPAKKLAAAMHSKNAHVRRMARSAKGLMAMHD